MKAELFVKYSGQEWCKRGSYAVIRSYLNEDYDTPRLIECKVFHNGELVSVLPVLEELRSGYDRHMNELSFLSEEDKVKVEESVYILFKNIINSIYGI